MPFYQRIRATFSIRAANHLFRQTMAEALHAAGLDDHQIADTLSVTVRSVRNYRRAADLPVNRKRRSVR
ncbi:hypothetical protein [Deinococcus koreensis]|uniref:HTH luxR-type domain-containing protein n=1 Tax=Deinococcus koreensis TaxID=2054903 RepID=A0A2K3UYN7_9DEIO|nr:hypothetical protein [Deinococcus koreensis]PNY81656.1 hypothetical protein CVO96_09980 [Deinococcus koreensis]